MDPKIAELKKKIDKLEKEIKGARKNTKAVKKTKFIPLKILYKWQAPTRVFIQRDKPWFLKIAIVALLLILFFAFLQDFVVILVICVVVLISFLLGSIPPRPVEHQILNKGVKSIDTMYKWKELKNFWVAEKSGYKILYITTKFNFPPRIIMLIGRKSELPVVKLLGKHLDYKEYEEKQGFISKLSDGEMINPQNYAHLFKEDVTSKRKDRQKK